MQFNQTREYGEITKYKNGEGKGYGYGFIRTEAGDNLFFHFTKLAPGTDMKKVRKGAKVGFYKIERQKGYAAVDVEILEGPVD